MSVKTRKRRSAVRIDPRIFIVIGVLLAVIAVLLVILLYHGKEEITQRGTMLFSVKNTGAVVIRDENTLLSSEHAKLDYLKEEGSEVLSGEKLATVYKLGFSDELRESLLAAREEVYAAQMERIGSTKDSMLDEMNETIASLRERIGDCVMLGTGDDLEELCRALDLALRDRMEYLKDKIQETETLRALYKKVEDKEQLISAWTEEITAPNGGIVSYYFDGFEQAINADKLGMISPDLVSRAISQKGSSSWTTNDSTTVCRIVNKNRWYVAFLTKSSELTRTCSGVEYDLEIKGYGAFKATALEPLINGDEVVNILEVTDDIGSLLDVRTATVSVSASLSGIKIKADAVRKEKGLRYIELVLSDSHYTLRIDVLAEEKDMVIVRPHEPTDPLNEGVRYWNRKR